ncbi:MAG: repressor LexA [Candidatus Tagabacteria bacterium CG_4_10_14_0_2_um_filter_40_13]|uniref:LexA repressor n=2 Tax=Candidatus Tagaibacteriota TaxID=1817918 RepID=A0A2M8G8T0_9BACT|nr:MAG: repressor LexA [Candidatus Tagabacteria bacterium CG11_big_fil_rev_8_21_14_0_20_41_11]PIZ56688.1 MAG: repressor LexA [Candidatus Tagabacteria bacterium CG_4_10_14_0_2_um_filter_40_13]PJC25369.1 MAG: repressor LexA [Candidatus Tagabacteria bacterium CG_4_9_14_0_2_um_filter_41_11]PJC69826.1 MAG: repressor LexA [Candidatus Tagabacteria bacterium CG_4_8_14_3_um_filter_41_8]
MNKKSSVWTTKPSKKQAEVLEFIAKFQREKGYSPSLGEIASHFKISIPTVHQHISYLRKKKLLITHKGKKRSIQPFNDQKSDLVEIPLLGLIAAGGPIEAIRNPEPIEVPRSMLSKGTNHYALKVSGTSMIEEGISDGDIVIVREQQTVDDGEKAVAYLPDKDAVTLKKIYRDKNRIKLVPANKTMKPFYEKNVEVQGKVVGVIRKYG